MMVEIFTQFLHLIFHTNAPCKFYVIREISRKNCSITLCMMQLLWFRYKAQSNHICLKVTFIQYRIPTTVHSVTVTVIIVIFTITSFPVSKNYDVHVLGIITTVRIYRKNMCLMGLNTNLCDTSMGTMRFGDLRCSMSLLQRRGPCSHATTLDAPIPWWTKKKRNVTGQECMRDEMTVHLFQSDQKGHHQWIPQLSISVPSWVQRRDDYSQLEHTSIERDMEKRWFCPKTRNIA